MIRIIRNPKPTTTLTFIICPSTISMKCTGNTCITCIGTDEVGFKCALYRGRGLEYWI